MTRCSTAQIRQPSELEAIDEAIVALNREVIANLSFMLGHERRIAMLVDEHQNTREECGHDKRALMYVPSERLCAACSRRKYHPRGGTSRVSRR